MDLDSIGRSADGIAAVIVDIDAGKLDASAHEHAYLRGALDTLRALHAINGPRGGCEDGERPRR